MTDYATVTSPEVIVWVYPDGQTASVETRTPGIPAATPPPARVEPESATTPTSTPDTSPSESADPSPVQAYAKSSEASDAASTPPQTFAPSPSADPSPAPSPASSPAPSTNDGGGSTGLGICYSPYNSDGTCKSQGQVDSDFSSLSSYSTVRIYGVDCNQVSTVLSAAASHGGIKIFAGLLSISNIHDDLASMIKQTNGNWGPITTISIGNELVDMGKASVSDVVSALRTARGILAQAGYGGSIVTVDTFNALIAHPELCTASDFCAANAHSFFDPTMDPGGAGAWVQKQVGRISDAAGGGKKVVITESGWPHAGQSNGVAVPSPENQALAMASIRGAFGADLFLFTAFDDKWKGDGAFGVEKNWGIM